MMTCTVMEREFKRIRDTKGFVGINVDSIIRLVHGLLSESERTFTYTMQRGVDNLGCNALKRSKNDN